MKILLSKARCYMCTICIIHVNVPDVHVLVIKLWFFKTQRFLINFVQNLILYSQF